MEKGQLIAIGSMMLASKLLLIISTIWVVCRIIKRRSVEKYTPKAGMSTALLFSIFLLGSIWLTRMAVGYWSDIVSKCKYERLTVFEGIFNSLFRSLRTFGLEEEYVDYVNDIKDMIAAMISQDKRNFNAIQNTTIVYITIQNLMAPFIGGAIILEVLAKIFPQIGLRWAYICFYRPRYFFSELNAASLALAKSIYREMKGKRRPILIFTDTYVDDEKEKDYELLLEAKKYGAICLRDDLAHVTKTRTGTRTYFLMDENEFGNLQTLMGLTEDQNVKYIRDSQIFLFVTGDAYVQVEKQINNDFGSAKKQALLKGKGKPMIIPINGYRNLVQNLFVEVPLYEPLIQKEDNTKLNITIFGNGVIGTEAFLNAYWFGQMMVSRVGDRKIPMTPCEVTINVVSKDEKEIFWSKIDYVNPEIKGTVKVAGDCAGSNKEELLSYNDKGSRNDPYCNVNYIKADVQIGSFWDSESDETKQFVDADYFIVALGSDADNISIADRLRRTVGQRHMENSGVSKKAVIAYAVFNSEIAEKLNADRYHRIPGEKPADIYMYAFGSLDSVYSYSNVCMSRYKMLAETIGASYDKSREQEKLIEDNGKRKNNKNQNYNYWANLARAMHIRYKVFSLGMLTQSIFDFSVDKTGGEHDYKEYVTKQCKKYIQIALGKLPQNSDEEFKQICEDVEKKKHRLAWLEHRRWNAFTRTMGYQHIDARKIFRSKEAQKDMDIKLHSCLVEARYPDCDKGISYIYAYFLDNGYIDRDRAHPDFKSKELDRLDEVTLERRNCYSNEKEEDFKQYDYYRYEFYEYLTDAEVEQLLKS